MIKLKNPYAEFPGYSCFACGPTNPSGLHMVFYKDGDEIVATWDASENYQGFHDLLHGGIQATMMDEIASWVVFLQLDTAGVTYALNTRFRKPVHISKGPVSVRASLVRHEKRIAEIEARLYVGTDLLCAESVAKYFVMPRDKAVNEFQFPGKEAFLKQT